MKLLENVTIQSGSDAYTFNGELWSAKPALSVEVFLLNDWMTARMRTHADLPGLAVEAAQAVLKDVVVTNAGLAVESDLDDDVEG